MTYEYVCTACGHEWEADHSISAPPLKDCPSCRKATAKRQVSGGTGFVLKGGGWYSDLYSSTKPPAKDSSESSSSLSTKDSGAADTGSKDSGSKETGAKDAGSKDSGATKSEAPSKKASKPSSKAKTGSD